MSNDHIKVFTTTDQKENAIGIARMLVENRLAACAQVIGPVTSTFWWKNRVDEEEEWLVVMKTRTGLYQEMEKAIKDIHTYEVPEIIASPIVAGNKDYLDWLDEEVGGE
ncbi:MAG TPA: divalent-cation tolerance protein CutA [Desulfobacteraceae bacterium]|nr:divalent-cation tolerance protein CutA [Desulfobacteraceae bacterium]